MWLRVGGCSENVQCHRMSFLQLRTTTTIAHAQSDVTANAAPTLTPTQKPALTKPPRRNHRSVVVPASDMLPGLWLDKCRGWELSPSVVVGVDAGEPSWYPVAAGLTACKIRAFNGPSMETVKRNNDGI